MGRLANVLRVAAGSAALWYLVGCGAAVGYGLLEKSTANYTDNATGHKVFVRSWPQITDWRRYFSPIVDRDGRAIYTINLGHELVTLLDDKPDHALNTKSDYVETRLKGTLYRVHGDGTVTKDGEANTPVDNSSIGLSSPEVLKQWNDFLSKQP